MRVPLTDGFTLIPEGEYVFRIYAVEQDDDFGIIKVHMVNAQGLTITERFSLKRNDEEYNDGALAAFSYFAKTVLNNYSLESVDPDELVDGYIRAEVVHNKVQSQKDPNKMNTFANLGNKSPADGFDTKPVEKALTLGKDVKTSAPAKTNPAPKGLDLDALLG